MRDLLDLISAFDSKVCLNSQKNFLVITLGNLPNQATTSPLIQSNTFFNDIVSDKRNFYNIHNIY